MKWRMAGLLAALLSVGIASAEEEAGKELLERHCTKCHTLASTLRQHNTAARWGEIVDDMVAKGAEMTDDEIDQLIAYLTRNHGPKVKVNSETAEALARALGIPQESAAAIVEYRGRHGDFKSIDDLKKVPKLDGKLIDAKKDGLSFAPSK